MTTQNSAPSRQGLAHARRPARPFDRARRLHTARPRKSTTVQHRLSPASSDRGDRSRPLDRGVRRSCPRRPLGVAAHRRHGTGADLGPRRHRRDHRRRPDRHAERARGGGIVPGNPVGADGGRRALARHHAASLPAGRSPNAADDQAELSEDHGSGRPLRSVAARPRTRTSTTSTTAENRPYHNFGCATQRNLAAMVDNPADLEQPRPESPAYTPRRDIAFEKYRKGTSTATTYPESDKAKLSDTGK